MNSDFLSDFADGFGLRASIGCAWSWGRFKTDGRTSLGSVLRSSLGVNDRHETKNKRKTELRYCLFLGFIKLKAVSKLSTGFFSFVFFALSYKKTWFPIRVFCLFFQFCFRRSYFRRRWVQTLSALAGTKLEPKPPILASTTRKMRAYRASYPRLDDEREMRALFKPNEWIGRDNGLFRTFLMSPSH